MLFEAAQNLGGLQERERARLSPKVNAALDEGRAISAEDYKVALVLRDAAIVAFTEWLDGYDAVLSPPAPGSAPEGLDSTGDPSCCTLWSLTGFPALVLPIGLARNGMVFAVRERLPCAGAPIVPSRSNFFAAIRSWVMLRWTDQGCILFRQKTRRRDQRRKG